MLYTLPIFGVKEATVLIKKALFRVGSELPSQELAEALMESRVTSPGLIVVAVEKYVNGSTAEEAARVEFNTEIDTHALCRAIVRGNWRACAQWLSGSQPSDMGAIRGSVAAYLVAILVKDQDFSDRGDAVVKAIQELSKISNFQGEKAQMAAMMAAIYQVAQQFKVLKRA